MTSQAPIHPAAAAAPEAERRMTRRRRRAELGLFAAIVLALLLAPLATSPFVVMKIMCFAMFALALNLLMGFTGIVSFGHAMFFGGGAYVGGYAIKTFGWPIEAGIVLAAATAALLGLATGALAVRRHGIYTAMVTLAFAQMLLFLAVQTPFTGGEDGLQSIPRGPFLGIIETRSETGLFLATLILLVAVFLIVFRTVHSPFGQTLKAIRENETRAISLGYRTNRYKLAAFVLSAALSGAAGAMKAVVFELASLTDVSWHTSGEVVLMNLVGGIGTMLGPIVGAAMIVGIQEFLSGIKDWILVINGAIFVVVVLAFRKGIVGEIIGRLARRDRR